MAAILALSYLLNTTIRPGFESDRQFHLYKYKLLKNV